MLESQDLEKCLKEGGGSKKRCVSIESLNLTQVMRQEHYYKNRLMIN